MAILVLSAAAYLFAVVANVPDVAAQPVVYPVDSLETEFGEKGIFSKLPSAEVAQIGQPGGTIIDVTYQPSEIGKTDLTKYE